MSPRARYIPPALADEAPAESPDSAVERLAAVVPIHERLTWDLNDLEALTGISRRTWERWKSARKLPEPIKIGRRVLYLAASIRAFLDDQAKTVKPTPVRALIWADSGPERG